MKLSKLLTTLTLGISMSVWSMASSATLLDFTFAGTAGALSNVNGTSLAGQDFVATGSTTSMTRDASSPAGAGSFAATVDFSFDGGATIINDVAVFYWQADTGGGSRLIGFGDVGQGVGDGLGIFISNAIADPTQPTALSGITILGSFSDHTFDQNADLQTLTLNLQNTITSATVTAQDAPEPGTLALGLLGGVLLLARRAKVGTTKVA